MMAICCEFDPIRDAAPARVESALRPIPARRANRARFSAPARWLAGLLELRAFLVGMLLGVGFWLPVFLTT